MISQFHKVLQNKVVVRKNLKALQYVHSSKYLWSKLDFSQDAEV